MNNTVKIQIRSVYGVDHVYIYSASSGRFDHRTIAGRRNAHLANDQPHSPPRLSDC